MSQKLYAERESPTSDKMERFAEREISMIFVCQTCGKGFLNETELAQHNMIGHSSHAQAYSKTCANNEDSAKHEQNVDGANSRCDNSRSGSGIRNGRESEGQEEYSTFEIELITYEDIPSKEQSQNLPHRSMLKEPRKKRMFKCVVCLEEFDKKKELATHMAIHPDAPEASVKNTKCKICDKTFSHNSALVKHQRIHSGEKPFKCDVCDKAFNAMCNLVTHKRIHSGEKPFVCKICGKSFSVQCNLTTHTRIHSGEKPFRCDMCDKSFTVYHNMLIHKRTHSGEKPFTCDVCKKQFSVQCNLITHMRTHSGEKPFECKLCGKNFRAQCNLNTHMHVHSDDKPHVCEVCGKGFGRIVGLERHRKTHLRPKKFECPICKQAFSNRSMFKKHEETHATFISLSSPETDAKDEAEFLDSSIESKSKTFSVDIQPLNQGEAESTATNDNEVDRLVSF